MDAGWRVCLFLSLLSVYLSFLVLLHWLVAEPEQLYLSAEFKWEAFRYIPGKHVT
jgi:hypothetical protein